MWVEIASYVYVPVGAYQGHYITKLIPISYTSLVSFLYF